MIVEKDNNKDENPEKEQSEIKPDPETLHTTDPQEHMKGPISSLMREVGEGFDDKDAESDKNQKKSKEE